jgi:uncharacterized membrane protein
MIEFLLKLLGGATPDAVKIAGGELGLRGQFGLGFIVPACIVVAAATWWLYRRSPIALSRGQRYTLTALRVVFMALLFLIIARPVLALTVEGTVRRLLLVLVDTSSSMQIKDLRTDPQDQKRAAIAGGTARDTSSQLARIDLVKAALKNTELDLLPKLQRAFDLQAFTFARSVMSIGETNLASSPESAANPTDLAWIEHLAATNSATALGDALRELVRRKRGQALAGVVVISDGANNIGIAPAEAGATLKAEGVPAYVYGVGVRSPRDIVVANLLAANVSFVEDDVHVSVRLQSQGLKGQEATVVLKFDGETVASRSISLAEGEAIVPLTFRPRNPGTYDLEAVVEPRADEAIADNNSRAQRLRVIDSKIKVLLVEQSPRWEFRYLQAMLLRDRRVELKCFLVEADASVTRAADSPYLPQFPATKDELFKYDVILFGDLDPKLLSLNQLDMLGQWVSDFGGGLIVLAGPRATPHAYRQTVLERLLPIELEALTLSTPEIGSPKPSRLELTASGRSHPMLRLSEDEGENLQLWKELPPIYWMARAARAKPAAEVLLADTDPSRETRHGKMPVVAVQQYGLGQVLYVGTDNTWRWRKNVGDLHYTAFWGQIIQRLALQRLLGGSKRTQLATDRNNYVVGDRVPIYARLYGVGFEPMEAPSVTGTYAPKTGTSPGTDVTLRPVPEQPGLFRGEFTVPAAGHYQFFLESDPETTLDFSVVEPQFELGDSAMNEPVLRDLAAQTGGVFFREEDLHTMPEKIRQRSQTIRSSVDLELWSSPACFLILLAVVTTEWLLRKRWYLK